MSIASGSFAGQPGWRCARRSHHPRCRAVCGPPPNPSHSVACAAKFGLVGRLQNNVPKQGCRSTLCHGVFAGVLWISAPHLIALIRWNRSTGSLSIDEFLVGERATHSPPNPQHRPSGRQRRLALRFPGGDPVNGGGRGTRKLSGDKALVLCHHLAFGYRGRRRSPA